MRSTPEEHVSHMQRHTFVLPVLYHAHGGAHRSLPTVFIMSFDRKSTETQRLVIKKEPRCVPKGSPVTALRLGMLYLKLQLRPYEVHI